MIRLSFDESTGSRLGGRGLGECLAALLSRPSLLDPPFTVLDLGAFSSSGTLELRLRLETDGSSASSSSAADVIRFGELRG